MTVDLSGPNNEHKTNSRFLCTILFHFIGFIISFIWERLRNPDLIKMINQSLTYIAYFYDE